MKKSNLKIHQFDPVLYPRLIWIAYDVNSAEVNKRFCYPSGKPLDFEPNGSDGSAAPVIDRESKKLGVLIWIPDTKVISDAVIVHEATHAALDILNDIGFNLDYENQEPLAYLIQFITECALGIKRQTKPKA